MIHKREVFVFTFQKSEYIMGEKQTPWLGWISPDSSEIFHSCFQGNNGIFLYDKLFDDKMQILYDDEMQTLLHKINKYTSLKVEKIARKTSGIRCSIKDDSNLVIGPSEEDASFIWCAALGGYGVQTSPAYSEIASYLAVNKDLPKQYVDLGIDIGQLLPSRLEKIY